jgi:hypothetical protein
MGTLYKDKLIHIRQLYEEFFQKEFFPERIRKKKDILIVNISLMKIVSFIIIILLLVISPWDSLAGTRTQSDERFGSGTLHCGQVLRGSLPLLSPSFMIWCGKIWYRLTGGT